ncbi:beta-glucosidase [Spirulina subsalsa FACHB-351]|uniref:beta-N-acetylhexosaminidase n=1 Tax=Spirulina subsalsa FACHB-351 TaxID=234711 RepID=A0ABT3L210_9CYAN|nr:glycoside hydrolase family 3 N-terminal domain-containing protein [Spirulina subsalsa]MCW6035541.1 beta-glucosidase [Spirulina subsalsa FACHB-351]
MPHPSLVEQIGQMIVVRASGHWFDQQIRYPQWEATAAQLEDWLSRLNVGGVILLGGTAVELAVRSQQLQAWAKTPLLLAADIEEGVGHRFPGATWFPPPMTLSAIPNAQLAQDYARKMGQITAQEAVALGLNWLLGPVVDVNNNPENPVINVRAFGSTREQVEALTTAFITGCQEYPILTTAKHFPGHGDTATDSHLTLPVLPHSTQRLAELEIPPFQKAIAAGVDTVMTAHLLIPAWDAESPATLSQPILTGQLRHKLGFEGLIVTDALVMAGVAQFAAAEEVCIRAVEAGADILLMPPHPEIALAGILRAVEGGRIAVSRIQESWQRIQRAKEKLGLFSSPKKQEAGIPLNLSAVATPEATATVEEILRESMQWGGNLPYTVPPIPHGGLNLLLVGDRFKCQDILTEQAPALARPRQLGYSPYCVDQELLSTFSCPEHIPLILQVFIRGNPFRGHAGLTPEFEHLFKRFLRTQQIKALAIYGSPYVLDWFHHHKPSDLPWVFSYGQMPIAQGLACNILLSSKASLDQDIQAFI